MKTQIGNIAFGVAILFSAIAVPAYSDTLLGFDAGSNASGVVALNGSNVVTGITNVLYGELTVFGPGGFADYTDLSASLTLNGNVLQLTGNEPSLGPSAVSSPPDLVDITLATPLINTGGAGFLDVAFPSTTSVTVSPALLMDIGITGPVTITLLNSGLVGAEANGSYDVDSETLSLDIASAAAPEPASLPLLGITLLGIVLFLRKRLFQLQ